MEEGQQEKNYPSIPSVFTHMLLVRMLGFGLGIANSIVVARALGAEGRGHLSLLLTTAMFLNLILCPFSASNTILVGREPGHVRQLVYNSVFATLLSIFILFVVHIFLPPYLIKLSLGKTSQQWVLLLIALLGFQIFAGSLNGILLGRQEFYFTNYISLINGVLIISLNILLIVVLRLDVTGALLVFIITWGLVSVLYFGHLRQSEIWHTSSGTHVMQLFREGLIIGFRAIASNLPTLLMLRSNVFLIQYFLGPAPVGIYTVAVNVAEMILIVSSSLNTILFAKAASEQGIESRVIQSAKFSLLVSLCFWIFLGVTGWWLLPIAYGEEFKTSTIPCLIIMAGICVWSFSSPQAGYVVGKASYPISYISATILGFIINLLLNLLLIPQFGIMGAAFAITAAYILSGGMVLWIFMRMTGQAFKYMLFPRRTDLNLFIQGFSTLKNRYLTP